MVTASHFLFDEAERGACLFKQCEQYTRLGRCLQQGVEETHQLPLGNHRIGQRELRQIIRTATQVGDFQRHVVEGRIHFYWPCS